MAEDQLDALKTRAQALGMKVWDDNKVELLMLIADLAKYAATKTPTKLDDVMIKLGRNALEFWLKED